MCSYKLVYSKCLTTDCFLNYFDCGFSHDYTFVVLRIKFDESGYSVIEGDVVTVMITADHVADVPITIRVHLTPFTATGKKVCLIMHLLLF